MKGFLWSVLLVGKLVVPLFLMTFGNGFVMDTGNTKCVDNQPNCKYINDTFATCSNDHTAQECSLFCGLCKTVHGGWSDWTSWDPCSVSCGAGLATRVRTCSNPKPDRLGDHCFGTPFESRICMQRSCANGGWSTWSAWGNCRDGMLTRNRTCNIPEPSMFGKQCEGTNMQTKQCRNQGDMVYFNAHSQAMHQANYLTFPTVIDNVGNGYHSNNGSFVAPVDGQYSFSAQICTYGGHEVDVALRHFPPSGSERTISYSLEYPPSRKYGCATTTAPVVLKSGEQVRVFTPVADTSQIQDLWTSFSGVLVERIYN